jgi:hypothetical protein
MKRTPIKRYSATRSKKPSLRRSRSTKPPTADELARFAAMRRLGCVACRLNREIGLATATFGARNLEIHHVLSGGRRIGHHATICLCHYHHQGKRLPYTDQGYAAQAVMFGPSLEREGRCFRTLYGTEQSLVEFQQELLAIAAELRQQLIERIERAKGETT